MDADYSIVLPQQWIGETVKAMNEAVYNSHGCFHINTDPNAGPIGMSVLHHECTVGTCGRLNSLIKRAQQMGYQWPSVPRRP